jgi:hypothetical protein
MRVKLAEEKVKKTFLKSALRTVLVLFLVICIQTSVSADSVKAKRNRIVGVWETQVTIFDCNTGNLLFSFPGMNKYELGGTAQVVPATNPAAQSAHMAIWKYVSGNDYELSFKMFRFDATGTLNGWGIVRFNVTINDAATDISASGVGEVYDINANLLATSCPTYTGTRFQ